MANNGEMALRETRKMAWRGEENGLKEILAGRPRRRALSRNK